MPRTSANAIASGRDARLRAQRKRPRRVVRIATSAPSTVPTVRCTSCTRRFAEGYVLLGKCAACRSGNTPALARPSLWERFQTAMTTDLNG